MILEKSSVSITDEEAQAKKVEEHRLRVLLEKTRAEIAMNCMTSFYDFYRNFWDILSPEVFVDNWHIHVMCTELEKILIRVKNRESNPHDTTFNIPPGSSKSSLISQAFPIWCWLHDPALVIITMSYNLDLAKDHSFKSKKIFTSQRFQTLFQPLFKKIHGKPIYLVKNNEKEWINNFGGIRYVTSPDSTATGKHAHIIIKDDPISAEQAQSEAYRKRVNRFNNETLSNRKVNKKVTATIMVMQRLHSDDPTGNDIKKEKNINMFVFPAELSKALQPRERLLTPEESGLMKPITIEEMYKLNDGLLDPVRLGVEELNAQKKELQSLAYAGQYGQEPFPEEGNKVKREWFNYCKLKEVPESGLTPIDLWVDGAYTKIRENDPTGLMVAAYHAKENRLYLFGAVDDWLEMPDLMKLIPEYCEGHNVNESDSRIRIEPKASGKSLRQLINAETDYNAVEINSHLVQEGKSARLAVAAPKIESGRVWLVEGAWTDHFVTQLCGYPNVDHDEFVDLIGYAVHHYFPKKKPKKPGEKQKPVSKASLGFR